MKPSKAELLADLELSRQIYGNFQPTPDALRARERLRSFVNSLPDEPAPFPTKPEGLEWDENDIRSRYLIVKGKPFARLDVWGDEDVQEFELKRGGGWRYVRQHTEGEAAAKTALETTAISWLSPVSDASDTVRVKREIYDFLMGAGALEGVHFGDKHPDERGAFWWRSRLRAAIGGEK